MNVPWRLGLLLALGGLVAAGCSSSPSKPSTTTSTEKTTTTTTAPATTTTAPITAAAVGCSGITATLGPTNGAAGTLTGSITLSETGPSCTVTGYPNLVLANGSATVPSTVVDGLTVDISGPANGAPSPVTWSPSSAVDFTYQYSDVPSGSEGTCPTATSMAVTPPGSTTAAPPVAITLAPCDNGTVRVSPIYAST
jgi:hypothetical protein